MTHAGWDFFIFVGLCVFGAICLAWNFIMED